MQSLCRVTKNFRYLRYQRLCSTNNSGKSSTESSEFKLPDEPTNCCMSGCEHCVWIVYAKDLTEMYEDSGETARKIILQKITDPSMQIFLKMELVHIDKKLNEPSLLETIRTKPPKLKK